MKVVSQRRGFERTWPSRTLAMAAAVDGRNDSRGVRLRNSGVGTLDITSVS